MLVFEMPVKPASTEVFWRFEKMESRHGDGKPVRVPLFMFEQQADSSLNNN